MRDIKPVYKRIQNKNYMIVEVSPEDLQYYEYPMLEYTKPKGFVDLEIRYIDDKSFIYYDISSKQSLARILEFKKLSADDVVVWIRSMNIAIENLHTYMLSDTGICLQAMYIYLDSLSFETEFMYVPGLDMDFQKEFSALLSMLIAHIDNRDERAVRLIYALYQTSLRPESRFEDFIDIIEYEISGGISGDSSQKDTNMHTPLYKEIKHTKENIWQNKEESTPVLTTTESEVHIGSKLDFLGFSNLWKHKKEKEELCTSLLSEHKNKALILKSLDNKSDIRIDSSPFIVGRQKGLCDYILDAEGISRLHFKLEKYKEDSYLIYDLNSKNGTKVNQMVLENEEYCIIHIGDVIEVAGLRYILT